MNGELSIRLSEAEQQGIICFLQYHIILNIASNKGMNRKKNKRCRYRKLYLHLFLFQGNLLSGKFIVREIYCQGSLLSGKFIVREIYCQEYLLSRKFIIREMEIWRETDCEKR